MDCQPLPNKPSKYESSENENGDKGPGRKPEF